MHGMDASFSSAFEVPSITVRRGMDQAANVSQEAINRASVSSAEGAEEGAALSAGQYLDKALHLIGKKMRTAASLVKERSPKEGASRSALESASNVLDATGRYMMRENISENVGGVIKRYPLRTLGVCFVVGFLAGNVTRAIRR